MPGAGGDLRQERRGVYLADEEDNYEDSDVKLYSCTLLVLQLYIISITAVLNLGA
eukprot:SAG22_NODE_14167_length_382_cov_1.632509_1_plen_54_part_10